MNIPNRARSGNCGLICFDMDNTLLDCEPLERIAKEAGVEAEVKRITEKAMNGEIAFEKAVQKRLELLKGLPVKKIEKIADNLPLTEGAKELIRELKGNGFVTGIITGGFDIVADKVAKKLGIDFFAANKLETEEGRLTGGFELEVNNNKGMLLKEAKRFFNTTFAVAVGDGVNDLAMLETADLGIAFCAKPKVKEKIQHRIDQKNLMKLLELIKAKYNK